MKYRRVFWMLIAHGHSPHHAGMMLTEARRKNDCAERRFARNWIFRSRNMVPRATWIHLVQRSRDPVYQLTQFARRR